MPVNQNHLHQGKPLKEWVPLLAFAVLFLWWWYFYQSSSFINDYGTDKPEWLYLLDGLITLPILCWFCFDNKKKALITAASLFCLVVFSGSYIIPKNEQQIWPWLAQLRWLFLALVVALEISAVMTVVLAIKAAIDKQQDPDQASARALGKYLPNGPLAEIFLFESRVWLFFLLGRRITPEQYQGSQHFSYHNKDGAGSNALGWIFVILFEAPLVHMLLHFVWSAQAANVVSGLTLLSLVFFIADYQAMRRRPISIDKHTIFIRVGLRAAFILPMDNIKQIIHQPGLEYRKARDHRHYGYDGQPNIHIELHSPIGTVRTLSLSLDNPQGFVHSVLQPTSQA